MSKAAFENPHLHNIELLPVTTFTFLRSIEDQYPDSPIFTLFSLSALGFIHFYASTSQTNVCAHLLPSHETTPRRATSLPSFFLPT